MTKIEKERIKKVSGGGAGKGERGKVLWGDSAEWWGYILREGVRSPAESEWGTLSPQVSLIKVEGGSCHQIKENSLIIQVPNSEGGVKGSRIMRKTTRKLHDRIFLISKRREGGDTITQ